ncbi:MAG: glycosyltransferase family 2 protein [Bacteroidetes bacterium]|nr:glycosyltransferase family 2 protein [Bacteroidota bacterium]
MKVTVQIPARNEEGSLPSVIAMIPKNFVQEILVVDGHSTDKTIEVAKSLGCRVITQPGKGYGDAMIHGFKNASGDVIISMDADGSPNPEEIPKLLEKMKEGYDLVLGSRYLLGAGSEDDTFIRYIGNKGFTWLTNLLHGTKMSDSLYLFCAMKKTMLNSLVFRCNDFSLCIEIPVKAHKAGFKIAEVACYERKRIADVSRVNAFIDGIKILFANIKLCFESKKDFFIPQKEK